MGTSSNIFNKHKHSLMVPVYVVRKILHMKKDISRINHDMGIPAVKSACLDQAEQSLLPSQFYFSIKSVPVKTGTDFFKLYQAYQNVQSQQQLKAN